MSDGGRPADPRARFAEIAGLPDAAIDLAEAALWIAAEEYPELDVTAYLARLDALAAEAAPALAHVAGAAERLAELNRFFGERGFRGNRDDYYDPRNSFLNEVLDRRVGIPITLSLVYLAVGRRLGLELQGISFPGHFLLRCAGAEGAQDLLVVDAFEPALLDLDACQQRLDAALEEPVPLLPEVHLRAAGAREILARLLGNLKRIYAEQSDLERALGCCDRILLLLPDALSELRDRALVYEGLSCYSAAAADLERLLELAPGLPGADALRTHRDALRAKRGALH